MRAMVAEPELTDSQAKDRELTRRSNARVSRWPNTLAALRKAKENVKKEREAAEERERKKMDVIEAERRAAERKLMIQRANELIYNQTDKMKQVKSAMLLAHTQRIRGTQILEKKRAKEIERKREEIWHNMTMRDIAKKEKVEAEKQRKIKEKLAETAKVQMEQLGELGGGGRTMICFSCIVFRPCMCN